MAANSLPSGIGDLFLLGDRMEEGLALHGPWLLRNTVPLEKFSPLLSEAREAEGKFGTARCRKAAAGKRFATLDGEVTSWLAKARLVVMLAYGSKWSESWIATGFTHRGTNVPKRIGPRIELSRALAKFFAEHREFEVPFAGVTAVVAGVLQKKLTEASRAVRTTKADAITAKRRRDRAEKKLRHEMRTVVVFLSLVLSKSDPRWLAFGLKRPDAEAPPRRRCELGEGSQPLKIDFAAVRPEFSGTVAA